MKSLIPKITVSSIILLTFFMEVWAYKKLKVLEEPPKKHTVKIFRMKFIPDHLTVKKGDTVEWVNKDFYLHDVTDEKNQKWTSKPFGQNEVWSKVVTEDEQYFCNLHKVMKGAITVE
tara:strand:+ start:36344 stop:36694 length:351 start_codon:yes stop_codon:yes gene_type:complete